MNCKIGDTIVYGGSGVCEIDDIRDIRYGRERPQKYYVLRPLFVKQAMTVFVPCNNENLTSKMQPVMTRDEAMDLIDSIKSVKCDWIEDRNERKDLFSQKLSGGNRKEIVEVISSISEHKERLGEEGKTLNMQDEKMLSDATQRINAELAVALDMKPDQVVELIRARKAG
ncbi:MAG: hypothetical protein IKN14_08825 [Clostridiales bacterium]|nr:hypothetical protein [Clostridiales bacterium]